jgi:hypothetical protein
MARLKLRSIAKPHAAGTAELLKEYMEPQPQEEPLAMREQTVSIASPKPLAMREQTVSIASQAQNDSVSIASPKPLAMREQTVSIASPKPLAENAFENLSGKEKLLLNYLFKKNRQSADLKEAKITTNELRIFLAVSAVRLRNLIYRLQAKDTLTVSSLKNGRSGWRKFKLNEGVNRYLILEESVSKPLAMREHSVSQTVSIASPKPLAGSLEEEDSSYLNKSSSSGSNQLTQIQRPLPKEWTEINFSELTALNIPFGQNHLRQVFTTGRVSAQELQESINHYAYDLRVTPGRKLAVQNHLGYFLNSLKNGPYAPPKGYKSPVEIARENYAASKKEEAARLEKLNAEIFESEYSIWWNKLTLDEQKKITLSDGIRGKVESQRFFKDSVWPLRIKEISL